MLMSATVEVDPDICLGSSMCQMRFGHLFTVGEDGLAVPIRPVLESQQDIDAAVDAMHGCPTGAITVTDEH
jgi:ferredoxin